MKNKALKIILKSVLGVLLALIIIAVGYVSYVLIAYHRIGDKTLEFENNTESVLQTSTSYDILSWNIGFCAYSQNYSFFMDGGKYSRAYSKNEVHKNLNGIIDRAKEENADFTIFQEVDTKSTRSYKVDERNVLKSEFSSLNNTFAYNYDSPYLFYPIFKPHGKSVSGLLSFSKYKIESSKRVELPVEKSFMKLVDLDRCYDKIGFKVDNGKTLYVYNMHLSAYTSDGKIAIKQLDILLEDMENEYLRGNYAICGGDFNKDLLGDSSKIFGVFGDCVWAKPFPDELLGENFTLNANVTADTPSCRDCDIGYIEGKTYVLVVDGFITSKNIKASNYKVIDEKFMHSDHNPVKMSIELVG